MAPSRTFEPASLGGSSGSSDDEKSWRCGSESDDNDEPRDPPPPAKRRKLSASPEADNGPANAFAELSRIKKIKTQPTQPTPPPQPPKLIAGPPPSPSFASLNVAPWLTAALSSMEIHRPTPIQKSCIPAILNGRDCIGGSRTGSGKTVAFAVPMLQRWAEDPFGVYGVVLTPTRYGQVAEMAYEPGAT